MAQIKIRSDGLFEIVHAPNAVLDYGFNWTAWMQPSENVITSTWAIDPVLTLSGSQNVANVTSTFVNGGDVGKAYTLTNTITTNQGRTDSRTLVLNCQPKGNN